MSGPIMPMLAVRGQPFDSVCWPDYRDDSAEQLRTLIQAKLQGRTVTAPAAAEIPILQLVDALKRSVAQALQEPVSSAPAKPASPGGEGKKKPARKATSRRSA